MYENKPASKRFNIQPKPVYPQRFPSFSNPTFDNNFTGYPEPDPAFLGSPDFLQGIYRNIASRSRYPVAGIAGQGYGVNPHPSYMLGRPNFELPTGVRMGGRYDMPMPAPIRRF